MGCRDRGPLCSLRTGLAEARCPPLPWGLEVYGTSRCCSVHTLLLTPEALQSLQKGIHRD